MPKTKINRIVLYRLLEPNKCKKLDLSAANYILEHADKTKKLFIKKTKSDPPWLPFLTSIVKSKSDILNTRHSFVLLCKYGLNLYAITGGSGYHYVKDLCDPDFGLSLSCKLIGPDEISALNQKPLKGDTQQISRVFSAYDPNLDIDNYHRLVKFIAGKGTFEGRSFTISGRFSLVLRTKRLLSNVDDRFNEIEEVLKQDDRIVLPKSFRYVIDEKLIQELDEKMEVMFDNFWTGKSDRDVLYLEFDDPLNQIYATQFNLYTRRNRKPIIIHDFDLDILKEALSGKELDSTTAFNTVRVSVINEDGVQIDHLNNLLSKMVCNLNLNNRIYLKQCKNWIEILKDAVKYADEEVRKLTIEESYMPDWTAKIADEDDYNNAAARSQGWLSIQPNKITIKGHSNIETCDLYDLSNKWIIHVKDTLGSKASYHFLQASTSANFFSEHPDFRKRVNKKWPKYFSADFKQDQMTVVIALAAEKSKLDKFPN